MERPCILLLLLAALLFVLPVLPALAQDEAYDTQLLLIHEDYVYPDKMMAYEKVSKALANAFAEHNIPTGYMAASTEDLRYVYITPVENYGGIDGLNATWEMLAEKMGEDTFKKMMSGFEGTYPEHRDYLLRLRNDLSYNPAHAMEPDTDKHFRHWITLYVKPGMEEEMQDVMKEWKAMYKKHTFDTGYRVYQGEIGSDTPMMMISMGAKDAADFYTASAMRQEKMGQDGYQLWLKGLSMLRDVDVANGRMRPDLGYQPAEQMGANMDN